MKQSTDSKQSATLNSVGSKGGPINVNDSGRFLIMLGIEADI